MIANEIGKSTPEPAPNLLRRKLPLPQSFIEGVLTEGGTLLGSPPKSGKSFLMLHQAVCIVLGWDWLGYPVTPCGVLYMDLENGERIMRDRLQQLLDGKPVSLDGDAAGLANLQFVYQWPRFSKQEHGLELLDVFLDKHPGIGVVMIDMIPNIRPPRGMSEAADVYLSDYKFGSDPHQFALRRHIALVVAIHTNKRKFDEENPMLSLSGSNGLAGAFGNLWVLHRPHGKAEGTLYIQSRDFDTDDMSVQREPVTGAWELHDRGDQRSKQEPVTVRARIIAAFTRVGYKEQRIRDLHEATTVDVQQIRNMLTRLEREGWLKRSDLGVYQPVPDVFPGYMGRLLSSSLDPDESSASPGLARAHTDQVRQQARQLVRIEGVSPTLVGPLAAHPAMPRAEEEVAR